MFAHGAQKLFGWFNGPGIEGLSQGFEGMGLKPAKPKALIAGASEAGGGALIALGLLTPVGAAALIGVMRQAVETVHLDKGFFNTEGGYEFPLLIAAAAAALVATGPGTWSLDEQLGTEVSGPLAALAAVGLGLSGPKLVDRLLPAGE